MRAKHKITRRVFGMGVAGAAGMSALGQSLAQDYPNRFIKIVVSLGAGSTSDVIIRKLAAEVERRTNAKFIIENRPGAGTRLAAEFVARSAPDGYTLLASGASLPSHTVMFKDLPYNVMRDFRPVMITVDNIFIAVVDAKLPVRTLAEFVAYAKANPDKVNYGSLGKNSVMLSIEAFKQSVGINLQEIPYRGGNELNTAILSGQVQFVNNPFTVVRPFLENGTMRALAVIGSKRLALLPDVPTTAEAGFPQYTNPGWNGLFVPAQTPQPIIDFAYGAFASALADPELVKQLEQLGAIVLATPPDESFRRMKQEEAEWVRLAQSLKIEPE